MPQQPSNPGWTPVDAAPEGWTPVEDAPPASAPPEQPGFFKRFAQGVGIPSSKEEAKALETTPRETALDIATMGGYTAATKIAAPYLQNLYEKGKQEAQEFKEATQNIYEGGPILANAGKAARSTVDFALSGVLSPVGGGSLYAWGEDVGQGNKPGAAGDALAVLFNALTFKSSRPLGGKAKVNKIAYAADLPETMNPQRSIVPVLKDLEAVSKETGPPKTVGELLNTVKAAKDRMNVESGAAMLPLRGKQYVPTGIADAIKSKITPNMVQTSGGRQMMTALQKAAKDYEKPWGYDALDAEKRQAEARLRSYYGKGSTAQYASTKTDVGVMVDKAIVSGVQDIVYPAMDYAAKKPRGYFENLKQRQGSLIQLEDSLNKQVDALATRSAKIKGSPRFSSENVSAYGHPASTPGVSIHKLQNIVVRENPQARANRAVKRAFFGRPVSKAAIYTYPVRSLIFHEPSEDEKAKTPAQMKKDIEAIRNKYAAPSSSNPALPTGLEK